MKIFTPKNGFVRMTRQYVGGIVAGCGLGAMSTKWLVLSQGAQVFQSPLFFIGAILLTTTGGFLALSEQRRLEAKRELLEQRRLGAIELQVREVNTQAEQKTLVSNGDLY